MDAFNVNIRFLRNRNNLSLQKFGDLFGLNRGQVHSYEDKSHPPLATILAIANHFNLVLEKFISEPMNDLNFESFLKLENRQEELTEIDENSNTYTLSLLQKLKSPIIQDAERDLIIDRVTKQLLDLVEENGELRKELLDTLKAVKGLKSFKL